MSGRYELIGGELVPVLEPPDTALPESCAICGCPFYENESFVTEDGDEICMECAWLRGMLTY